MMHGLNFSVYNESSIYVAFDCQGQTTPLNRKKRYIHIQRICHQKYQKIGQRQTPLIINLGKYNRYIAMNVSIRNAYF